MSRVRARDTGPELRVRGALRAAGFGYRLHARDLPGSPDILMRTRLKAIFVHGCFWHRHPGCRRATVPKTNSDFWLEKLERNFQRDQGNLHDLAGRGWDILVVWECETRSPDLPRRLREFVEGTQ